MTLLNYCCAGKGGRAVVFGLIPKQATREQGDSSSLDFEDHLFSYSGKARDNIGKCGAFLLRRFCCHSRDGLGMHMTSVDRQLLLCGCLIFLSTGGRVYGCVHVCVHVCVVFFPLSTGAEREG